MAGAQPEVKAKRPTGARSACTCAPRRNSSRGGGGGGGAGFRDPIARLKRPASPQRHLPGGERASARTGHEGREVSQIPPFCLSSEKGRRGEQNAPPTVFLMGVTRCFSLPENDLKNQTLSARLWLVWVDVKLEEREMMKGGDTSGHCPQEVPEQNFPSTLSCFCVLF